MAHSIELQHSKGQRERLCLQRIGSVRVCHGATDGTVSAPTSGSWHASERRGTAPISDDFVTSAETVVNIGAFIEPEYSQRLVLHGRIRWRSLVHLWRGLRVRPEK